MSGSIYSSILTEIDRSIVLKKKISNDKSLLNGIEEAINSCLTALRGGFKIILCGNGGSFGDAQHIAAEFVSRFMFDRAPLPAVALGTNNSTISAVGNDYGYDQVFARELAAIGVPGDFFIPLSTSGNSPNVLEAMKVAKSKSITMLGLTGEGGGKMSSISHCIKVPANETARIQECHILIGHIICMVVEEKYFNPS